MRIITSAVLSFFVLIAAACGRSDKAIEAGVKARLAADPVVHSRQIDVDSHEGTVTLSGRIDTREERQHAMQVAASTEGVLRVIDHLEVASAVDVRGSGFGVRRSAFGVPKTQRDLRSGLRRAPARQTYAASVRRLATRG